VTPSRLQQTEYHDPADQRQGPLGFVKKAAGYRSEKVLGSPETDNSVATGLDFLRTARPWVCGKAEHKQHATVPVQAPLAVLPDETFRRRLPCHRVVPANIPFLPKIFVILESHPENTSICPYHYEKISPYRMPLTWSGFQAR